MNNPVEKRLFRAWLRFLGWAGFSILAMATVLIVARWYLMGNAHHTAMEFVKQGRTRPPRSKTVEAVGENSAAAPSAVPRGKPVAEIPLLQAYLDSESPAGKELDQALSEMSALLTSWRINKSRVNGIIDFRSVLGKMGVAGAESMTEPEAAAEFLKRIEKFSGLLAQWQDAVAAGPWDLSSVNDTYWSPDHGKIVSLTRRLSGFLGVRTEAFLQIGNTPGAFFDWQTMALSAERCGDHASIFSGMVGFAVKSGMFRAAQTGMELGAWTDGQLAEISATLYKETALTAMGRNLEGEKIALTDYFARPELRNQMAKPLLNSNSPVDEFVNQLAHNLTTKQQMADNLAIKHYKIDQSLSPFDPDTGVYQASQGAEGIPAAKRPDSLFDKFYFMYSDDSGDGIFAHLPERIIKNQTAMDQARLAAALEMHQRATGQYPETLDAVSASFDGAIPRDIATGKSYSYKLNPDGGYTLWGTGIDGTSEGGHEKSDVTWTHRPAKVK